MHSIAIDRDGQTVALEPKVLDAQVKWTEQDLAHLLTLAPQILGVESLRALALDGGAIDRSPDLLYLHPTGRMTVVELKKGKANLDALAQTLAYGEHLRTVPPELGYFIARLEEAQRTPGLRTRAIADVRAMLDGRSRERLRPMLPILRRERGARLPEPVAPDGSTTSRPLIGHPPRLVLIAKSFDDEVVNMAGKLANRDFDLSLIRIGIACDGPDRVLVSWSNETEPRCRVKTFWEVAEAILREPDLSLLLRLNGFAEHTNRRYSSFALAAAWPVKIFVCTEEGPAGLFVSLSTELPHKWCPRPERRAPDNALREEALARTGSKTLTWRFAWPTEREALVRTCREVVGALTKVLSLA